MAVAALSFEPPAFSSLLAEALALSLDLSPPFRAGFLLGAMSRLSPDRCSELCSSRMWGSVAASQGLSASTIPIPHQF